jgi:hypothetical protein
MWPSPIASSSPTFWKVRRIGSQRGDGEAGHQVPRQRPRLVGAQVRGHGADPLQQPLPGGRLE